MLPALILMSMLFALAATAYFPDIDDHRRRRWSRQLRMPSPTSAYGCRNP